MAFAPRYRSIVFALAGDSTIISVLAFIANAAAAFDADPPARPRVPRPAAAAAANASPPPRLPSPLAPRANARALDAIHPRAPRVVIPIEARARRVAVVEVAVAVARDDDDDDALGARARMHATRERARADEIDDAAFEVARATTATRSMRARRASATTSGR